MIRKIPFRLLIKKTNFFYNDLLNNQNYQRNYPKNYIKNFQFIKQNQHTNHHIDLFDPQMQNIIFNNVQTFQQTYGTILHISYQQATNTLVLVNHQHKLIVLEYNPKQDSLKVKQKTQPLQQLSITKILLASFLVELDKVVCITEGGSIFTVDQESNIDIKAENQDGIAVATISPTQEYIYVVTKNSTLIQLDMEFDLVNQVPLDQNQQALSTDPRFSWRPDGNYFALNIQTINGRKCVTRDKMMNSFISPSKSDPDPKGLVQSIAQKGRQTMGSSVAWQPNGGIIAGTDILDNKHRVIFWQKNGLRHLQFDLLPIVKKVTDLFWSPDSTTLFVDCITSTLQAEQQRILYIYYRSNYKWHLKNQILLTNQQKVISFKTRHNKILLAEVNGLRLIDFTIQLSNNEWLTKQQEKKHPYALVYCIDGHMLKVSDYFRSLIPPPMSLYTINTQNVIIGHSIKKQQILIITQKHIKLYNYKQNKITKTWLNEQKDLYFGIALLSQSNQPLQFISNNHFYRQKQGKIVKQQKIDPTILTQRVYTLTTQSSTKQNQTIQITASKVDSTLIINSQTLTQDCLSYMFYHQFLLYTVGTNEMYDKLYVWNLKLDKWIWDESVKQTHERIEQVEQKQLLNSRNVERGSKIITCSNGRVVFQLPRGNLEGIYPKVIMINQVKNKLEEKQFGKAFEIIRTHRLDLNLMIDINPQNFIENAREILQKVQRVDYLNLLISQLSQKISSQTVYCLSQDEQQQVNQYFDIHLKGKKVKKLCEIISKELRGLNTQKFILSIFTSDIRRDLLNQVLFEIKDLKKNDVESIVPPHIVKDKNATNAQKQKSSKKLNSQQILEYVCWLVDANYIYQAALLTYDLQLAAMTARCTQKDPKQYIPYIQSLKQIQNQVQFKKKIALDLKRYDVAIKQLAVGTQAQQQQAVQIVKKQKLYKQGLQIFSKSPQKLKLIKYIIIEQLLTSGQTNQAYQLAKSIGDYQKCIKIATSNMDTKKIKQCLESMDVPHEERIKKARQILQSIKDQAKNKSDLARLYIYVGQYEEAVSLYLKNSDYRKFYQYINKVSDKFIQNEVIPGLKLQCSLKKNQLLKDINAYHQKYARLLKVQKHKKNQGGQVHTFKNKQNEDMYSQVSMSSKASSYTISTTTGMRKKKQKKRDILTRNVKQGSILQQQYLLAFMTDVRSRAEQNIKSTKLLVQHLIYMNMIDEAEEIKGVILEYIDVMNERKAKSFAKIKFQELHIEAAELYYDEDPKKNNYTFDSFNYLLK